ncbi:hypothetical protein [uncultured Thiothrix sp.]|uniref:hypothetical protein n=1 Tax=uncultured Thiothrix sp. TaxID=223185 RepID=UPI002612238D|nr:hypothetical protein [uncultured Thiothrix sp.]
MASFRWLNNQGVKSDSGFAVQRTGRFTAEYSESGHTIVISVEAGIRRGKHVLFYKRASFSAWCTDPMEQQRVIDNFRSAITFMGSTPNED